MTPNHVLDAVFRIFGYICTSSDAKCWSLANVERYGAKH